LGVAIRGDSATAMSVAKARCFESGTPGGNCWAVKSIIRVGMSKKSHSLCPRSRNGTHSGLGKKNGQETSSGLHLRQRQGDKGGKKTDTFGPNAGGTPMPRELVGGAKNVEGAKELIGVNSSVSQRKKFLKRKTC